MNNQQWQPGNRQQQPFPSGWPPQTPSQPLAQPYPGYSAPLYAPSQPLPPSQPWGQPQPGNYEAPPAQLYTPPPPNSEKATPSRKKGFLTKRVGIPVWAIILTFIVMLSLLVGVLSNSASGSSPQGNESSSTSTTSQNTDASQPTAAPTEAPTQAPTPTHTPVWTTVQTFTGNGIKQTQTFTVGNDWKVIWSCDPSSFTGGQYNVVVYVYSSDGTPVDVAVNTICKTGNTSDSTEEHQGGSIYLDVNSEGSWKLQVQELQ